LSKKNKILVAYTKDHLRFLAIASNPPEGILLVGLTKDYKKNSFLKHFVSKVDIFYEDGSNVSLLRTDQPVVKEYESRHFLEVRIKDKKIKKIFLLSKWAKPDFADPENKMEVLYPSLSIKKHKPRKPKKKITIFLSGSAAFLKGVDIVFYAFENLNKKFKKHYNLSLIMASNHKPYGCWYPLPKDAVERLYDVYRKSKKIQNVYFGPIYPKCLISYFYRNADIFVLPSRCDSFGVAVVEAMSYGLPVVTTNINSFPERVYHGKNGFLIDVKNFAVESNRFFNHAVKELEKYLTILIEDDFLRLKMGEESREIVKQKFSIEYKKKRLKEVFEEIIHGKVI